MLANRDTWPERNGSDMARVAIYRPGRAPRLLKNPVLAAGKERVARFVLPLERIFPR